MLYSNGFLSRSKPVFGILCFGFFVITTGAQSGGIKPAGPSLREAVEAAWLLDPVSRTAQSRQKEISAKQKIASSWMAGAPSIALAHRTDFLSANSGLREYEAELDIPLWRHGVQSALQQQNTAEEALMQPAALTAKLKIASALRDLVADYALAQVEHDLALRKITESEQLAADINRRLKAGDVARLDALHAQAFVVLAQGQAASAIANKQRLLAQWKTATGLAAIAEPERTLAAANEAALVDQHPSLGAARAQLQLAQAKQRFALTDRSDPLELALGLTRQQSAFGVAAQSNLRIALRIPLGNDNRNASRIAGAQTELDLAQAELDATSRTVEHDIAIARAGLIAAQNQLQTSRERASLVQQAQALINQAYKLGERDLQARLRADSERYEADLASTRAQLDEGRAAAKLSQALGLLP